MDPYETIGVNGLRIDSSVLQHNIGELAKRGALAKFEMQKLSGGLISNPRSKKELNNYRMTLGLAPLESVAKDFLRKSSNMDSLLIEAIIESRSMDKRVTDLSGVTKYIVGDGLIHVEFTEAKTGRWYTKAPNIQTIALELRKAIVPRIDGRQFWTADFIAFELRVLAKLSNDVGLLLAVGGDAHQFVATYLGITRDQAKLTTYAILYGVTADSLTDKIPGSNGQDLIDAWKNLFPGVMEWMGAQVELARTLGYVTSPGGRQMSVDLPEFPSEMHDWERRAANYPMQCGAAEIQTKALELAIEMGLGSFIDMQNHDATLFELTTEELPLLESWKEAVEKTLDYPMNLKGPASCWGDLNGGPVLEEE